MTFVIKTRGDSTAPIVADFECVEHGMFDDLVQRGSDVAPCPECGRPSEWRISTPMVRVRKVEAVKGKWAKPERETYTDTRNVGEGQPLYEWKDDRAEVWERKRQQDVINFAKEH